MLRTTADGYADLTIELPGYITGHFYGEGKIGFALIVRVQRRYRQLPAELIVGSNSNTPGKILTRLGDAPQQHLEAARGNMLHYGDAFIIAHTLGFDRIDDLFHALLVSVFVRIIGQKWFQVCLPQAGQQYIFLFLSKVLFVSYLCIICALLAALRDLCCGAAYLLHSPERGKKSPLRGVPARIAEG